MNRNGKLNLLRFEWLQEDKELKRIQLLDQINNSQTKDDEGDIGDLSDLELEDFSTFNNVLKKHMDVNYLMTNKNENDINNISNKLLNRDLTTFLRRK